MGAPNAGSATGARLEALAASFRRFAEGYPIWGSPLYGALAAGAAEDSSILALASNGPAFGEAFQLFAAVHYLLLQDSRDPLAQYYPTFSDQPGPCERAFPHFARFCAARQDEIAHLLATRTVQQTYVERCNKIMPAIARVADEAGEPLNLIEIGCSAGVLLTFDRYAYDLGDGRRIGRADAPLTLSFDFRGEPLPRIPRIGRRIGVDLHPIDVSSDEERLWVMAQTFPESRVERGRLGTALNVVRTTEIQMLAGDAVDVLPRALASMPSPVCVFHSACLMHLAQPTKDALHRLLLEAGKGRDIYRVGAEPPEDYLQSKDADGAVKHEPTGKPTAEITVIRYGKNGAEVRGRAASDAPSSFFHWVA